MLNGRNCGHFCHELAFPLMRCLRKLLHSYYPAIR
jgi:hypothetical protein